MIHKMIDGKLVECTAEEEASIRAQWLFHESYPGYEDCMLSDEKLGGAVHDNGIARVNLEKAKEVHAKSLKSLCAKCCEDIKEQIEAAEEVGDEALRAALIQKRKELKQAANDDLQKYNSLEEMIASMPKEMKDLKRV